MHIFKINMRQEGPLVVVGCKMSKKIVRIFLHTLITSTYKNFFLSVCNGFANLWCYLCQNEKWSPSMRTICENAFRIHEGKNSRQTECELFMKAPIKINPRFNELWLGPRREGLIEEWTKWYYSTIRECKLFIISEFMLN